MKKFKVIPVVMALVMMFSIVASAEEINGDMTIEEGAQVYIESDQDRELRERKEAEIQSGVSVCSTTSEYTLLNVTVFMQENGYYCGPATVKQVVHYIMGTSGTQSYYAGQLGTTEDGTDMTKIPGVLNAAIGEEYFVYDPIDSKDEWMTEISRSIALGRPAILDINTTALTAVFPYSTTGHFVNLSGEDAITTDGDGYYFRIADCSRLVGAHSWYTKDDLYQANYNHFRKAYIW